MGCQAVLLVVILVRALVVHVQGHGRLIDPPSRASAWRYGFNTPKNYNDNQLYCGGKQHQWGDQNGKCGVCGDPWDGPRDHEAGGTYATGTIVKHYQPGQVVQVKVHLTANHKGWFEFRLCPNNDPTRAVTHSCLDRYKLSLVTGGTRLPITSDMTMVTVSLRLPRGLTCSQCVLQWKYNAGNSWGTDQQTGRACVGCGPQEQFYGCSDISIGAGSSGSTPNNRREPSLPNHREPSGGRGQVPNYRPGNGERPRGSGRGQGTGGRRQSMGGGRGQCVSTGAWAGQNAMDRWCVNNCAMGNCPPTHCRCG